MTTLVRPPRARRGLRAAALVAVSGMVATGITLGTQTAANAVPVPVTTTLTSATTGQVLDGYVSASPQGSGTYASQYVTDGLVNLQLEPGVYKLRFEDAFGNYQAEWYQDAPTSATAIPVTVSGPMALAPVSLAPRPAITGNVVNAAGKPITEGSVEAYDEAGNYANYTRLKADGSFSIGADLGNYRLKFSASGYASEFYNNQATLAAATPIAVSAAGASVGTVSLSRGAVITGRVTNTAGAPLERVRVSAPFGGSDFTDANGVYRLENLEGSSIKVQFSDPLGEYLGEWWNDKATEALADPIAITPDTVQGSIDAVLAPDPSNVIDPAKVDLAGTLVDSAGVPVAGGFVEAYDTPTTDRAPESWQRVRANRAGQFFFTTLNPNVSETQWKLKAYDDMPREDGQYARLMAWSGGTQAYDSAAVLTSPSAGHVLTLPLTGGIAGTITSESGIGVDGVAVTFAPVNNGSFDRGYMRTTATPKDDGTYNATWLVPGQYKVGFYDYGTVAGDRLRRHAPEWFNNTGFKTAKIITVKSGQTVGGINAALSEQLMVLRKPEIRGKAYLKGTVRAFPGVWNMMDGTTFVYEWLINGTVVGTGPSLKISKAMKNKRLTLRVTAENGDMADEYSYYAQGAIRGQAMVSTWKIKKQPKIKIKVNGTSASITVKAKGVKAKKIKGKVVAKVIRSYDAYGNAKLKKAGKAKIKNGKATVNLKKLKKGKNKVVFTFKFKGKIGQGAVKTKKVKIKK